MQPLHHLPPDPTLPTACSRASPSGPAAQDTLPFVGPDDELSALRDEVVRLQVKNARLLRLLELTPPQARRPGSVRTGVFDGAPGPVHAGSPAAARVAFV